MKYLAAGLLLACALGPLRAEERVMVCHDYGCARETEVSFGRYQLREIDGVLAYARSAADERLRLSLVIGQMYEWAGEQSPVWQDRGGNYRDEGLPGAMDCIDHSTTTTRFLLLIEGLGMLHYHRVLAPEKRGRIFEHYSAAVEEIEPELQHAEGDGSGIFVIDSWFGDNGAPAVVMPIEDWRNGGGPDV
jgi:hypothetical protein